MTVIIGIDPDLQASGVAVVIDGHLRSLCKRPFLELQELVREEAGRGTRFILEDARDAALLALYGEAG